MTAAKRTRRGFTLVELMVVCLLISVLGAIVVQAVSSIGTATAGLEKRTVNQVAARNIFDQLSRSVASATSLGTCGVGATREPVPVSQCSQIVTEPFTLASATPTSVSFYANADNQLGENSFYKSYSSGSAVCSGQGGANQCGLAVPDMVFITWTQTGTIATGTAAGAQPVGTFGVVRCQPPASATYTNPPWSPTMTAASCPAGKLSQTVAGVSPAPAKPVLAYLDSAGNTLAMGTSGCLTGQVTCLSQAELAQVALIEVTAQFNTHVSGYSDSFTLSDDVALPGASPQ